MSTKQPNVFLGRQPILDRKRQVVAYELLFRSDEHRDEANVGDDALATAHVVQLAFHELGISTLVGRSRAFVNVDAEFLMSRLVETLPPERVVLEILETVNIDARLLNRCRRLRTRGYRFALDDFLYREDCEPLLDIVDIVKVDVLQMNRASLEILVRRLKLRQVTLLAEKVDSADQARHCRRLGFDLFQGFHFGRPLTFGA